MNKKIGLIILCIIISSPLKSQDYKLDAFDSAYSYWLSHGATITKSTIPFDSVYFNWLSHDDEYLMQIKVTNDSLFYSPDWRNFIFVDDSISKQEIIYFINTYIVEKTENIIDICAKQFIDTDYDIVSIRAYQYGRIQYKDKFILFEERKYNKGFLHLLEVFKKISNTVRNQ